MGYLPIIMIPSEADTFGFSKSQWLTTLFLPVARFCLRNSLHLQEALEALKVAFIQAARERLELLEERENVSRLSASTGIQRKEIQRLLNRDVDTHTESQGLLSRLVGRWLYHRDYCDGPERPRPLSRSSEFPKLVQDLSLDLNPGTILFQLRQSGLIEENESQVILRRRVLNTRRIPQQALESLGKELSCYCLAVEENLDSRDANNHHAFTSFDAIPLEVAEQLRSQLWEIGTACHKQVRKLLATVDEDCRDIPRHAAKTYVRLSFGSFSLCERPPTS